MKFFILSSLIWFPTILFRGKYHPLSVLLFDHLGKNNYILSSYYSVRDSG